MFSAGLTGDPKHNTEHRTRNTEDETRNTQHATGNTKHGTRSTKRGTRNTERGTRNIEHEARNLIRTSMYDKCSGSTTKKSFHLDHISNCRTTADKNWSNRRANRVFVIDIRRDEIQDRTTLSSRTGGWKRA